LALAPRKSYNAAVKQFLPPEQYAKWEPLREPDHRKVARAHKERDEMAAKAKAAENPSAIRKRPAGIFVKQR